MPSGRPPAPGEVVAGLVDGPLATAVAAATVREAVARGARIRFLQVLPAPLGAAAHTTAASFLFGIAMTSLRSEARRDAEHCRKLGVQSAWDVETTSTVVALRTLARRAHAMLQEARELQKAILTIIRSWRPDLLEEFGVGPIVAAMVLCAWSQPRPCPLRSRVRNACRRRADPRQQRPGHHPVPAQP